MYRMTGAGRCVESLTRVVWRNKSDWLLFGPSIYIFFVGSQTAIFVPRGKRSDWIFINVFFFFFVNFRKRKFCAEPMRERLTFHFELRTRSGNFRFFFLFFFSPFFLFFQIKARSHIVTQSKGGRSGLWEGDELSLCPSWSNSLWQGWSCGLVYCPGGNATDPISRVLASSQGISSWTPLKPQHSIPCWLSVQWEPSACRSCPCCQKKGSSKVCGWICSIWPSWAWESQHASTGNSVSWSLGHSSRPSFHRIAFFPSLKQNFIAYRSSRVSSRPDCIHFWNSPAVTIRL